MQVPGPFVIVAPLSLLPNWIKAFKQFSNVVTCLIGTKEDREAMYSGRLNKSLYQNGLKNADYPVIITSYEVAINDKQKLNKIGGPHVIIDEGEGFERYRYVLLSSLKYRSAHRWFLPASPINCAKDMLTLLHFFLPNLFDRPGLALGFFIQIAQKCDERKRHQIEAKLRTILNAFTVHGL